MPISTIDSYMIEKAQQASTKSHDPDRQVGVVVAVGDQILSTGANQPPVEMNLSVADSRKSISSDPNWKYYVFEHAERNAILHALINGKNVAGSTMYSTLYPCSDCARAIVASKISRLVTTGPGSNPTRDAKWSDQYRYASEILMTAGVIIDFVDK